MPIEFLITSFLVVLAPGTGVVYTISIGLTRGALTSVCAAAGCTLGIVPHMAAAIFGLAALLHSSALAFQLFKLVGVAYLLYLAWMTLRDDDSLSIPGDEEPKAYWRVALTGFLINILNPKLSVFFLAFLPQFVENSDTALGQMLRLSGVFMLMTFVVFIAYGVFAAQVRRFIVGSSNALRWMRRVFALSFAALATKLLLAKA